MDNNAVQCISTTTAVADDSDNDEVTDFLNSNSSPNALTPLSTVATSITTTTSSIATTNTTTETANLNTTTTSFNNLVENSKANLNNINRTNTVESQNYCIPVINTPPPNNNQQHSTQSRQSALTSSSFTSSNNNNNNNNNNTFNSQQLLATKNDNNMIPIINVTPHSPANVSKYNNIFEDTLSQLQNIRESVVQMKNSSTHMNDSLSNYGLVNATILSASLPDLSATGNGGVGSSGVGPYGPLAAHFVMWSPQQQQQYLLNADRRKSWTGIDDLTAGGDCTNKSVSLSSLDSEEQETIRVTEQRRRSARNSTGGISTHSLNEAELARDFERIAAKRSLATEIISRIPLQKSISTSSIVAKEDIKAIARHLTDSEDENQSLLRAHAKIEVYDNVEKRRKRGSLFFRKKKDKTKMKSIGGQVANCDVCGVSLSLGTLKDHQLECKGGGSGSGGKKGSTAGLVGGLNKKSDKNEMGQDFYDGTEQNSNYNDDNTPLIRSEFLNDAPIEAHDLKADPALGICLKEHDSWSPGIPKDILKTLKDTQIKRQEHIYEFIMTEKHHCQTLLVMQKVFVESMERYFPALNCNKMFPRLQELTELHCGFLKKLRLKQKEHFVVDSIADILLEFFSLEKAQHLRLAYGEFCANHRSALEQFKSCMTSRDPTFSEWYKHCLTNPLLKKKGIPECILFVTQRLTKYPLLIEPLLKSAREDKLECDKLQHALALVKELLVDVDACVAEKELRERQIDIYNRIDNKSFAIYKNKPFRKTDVGVESKRRLKFEGLATLMQGRSKMQLVLVVVLTDCLCFLNENSAHNKYMFFTPEHKAGVVPLQKLLIREKAGTESRGIYIISSNPLFPEMYELKVQTPKDKNVWIQSIRQAVLDCPSSDVIESEDLTHEEKLRIGVNKREIIEKIRQKDIEQAILLEEKILLQLNLIQKDQKLFAEQQPQEQQQQQQINNASNMSAAQFLTTFGSYKDLSVGADCDTGELWKKVLNTVQDITQLASTVYTAATGQPVSRSVSSVGEKHSDTYNSPTLPKRAETFAGFDEKRAKNNFPCRADKLSTLQVLSPRLQELEETKKETKNSSIISTLLATAGGEMDSQICDTLNPSGGSLAVTKDNNLALLQVTHNLHTLLCIISQQMTTIQSLQLQLALYRESPRASYTHNDQLEELRNLQDKLQEEKTAWMRQREQQEQELNEKKEALDKMQEQINTQQEDIKQQREQLYRKMEVLSSQGLLISPNTPLNISTQLLQSSTANNANELDNDVHDSNSASNVHDLTAMTNTGSSNANACNTPTLTSVASTVDRRKDKWRTASTISKTPPVNLLSATNAPKTQANVVKQKIPMKLSSLSSTTSNSSSSSNAGAANKVDKSNSFTTNNHYNSSSAAGITQMFPLKLADKRNNSSTPLASQLIPQHSRTGSSPAIIQHPQTPHNSAANLTSPTPPSSAGVTRTDSSATFTYGQRYSLGSANAAVTSTPTSSRIISHTSAAQTKIPHMSTVTAAASTTSLPSSTNSATSSSTAATSNRPNVQTKPEEEEIYF